MLQAYLDASLGTGGSADRADSTEALTEGADMDVVDVLDVSFFVNRLQLGLGSPQAAKVRPRVPPTSGRSPTQS
jgi:hypothetical protein